MLQAARIELMNYFLGISPFDGRRRQLIHRFQITLMQDKAAGCDRGRRSGYTLARVSQTLARAGQSTFRREDAPPRAFVIRQKRPHSPQFFCTPRLNSLLVIYQISSILLY